MAGGQLHRVAAVGVVHDQLAAVVMLRIGKEERRGEVRAQALPARRVRADRVVDVVAEVHAVLVAVEERREHAAGQRGREEEGVAVEGGEHDALRLAGVQVPLGQLEIALHLRRLRAGGGTAVGPVGRVEERAHPGEFVGVQDFGDGEQHGDSLQVRSGSRR